MSINLNNNNWCFLLTNERKWFVFNLSSRQRFLICTLTTTSITIEKILIFYDYLIKWKFINIIHYDAFQRSFIFFLKFFAWNCYFFVNILISCQQKKTSMKKKNKWWFLLSINRWNFLRLKKFRFFTIIQQNKNSWIWYITMYFFISSFFFRKISSKRFIFVVFLLILCKQKKILIERKNKW